MELNGIPLLRYIFDALKEANIFEEIFCYTSDPSIASLLPNGVKILPRDPRLDLDSASHEELWIPAIEAMPRNSTILMSHATSPLLSPNSITKAHDLFNSGNFDSVFGVQEIKSFIWFKDKTLNYQLGTVLPTQSLLPIHKETSGIYFFKREGFLHAKSRIHGRTSPFVLNDIESIDIDTLIDFKIAEVLIQLKGNK